MGEAWFESLPYALAAAAVWTAVLFTFAGALNSTRKSYQYGLGAAVFAYVVAIAATGALIEFFPQAPVWIFIVVVPPLVEECVRAMGVVEVRHRTDRRGWVAFGFGYGALESGLKLFDGLVIGLRMQFDGLALFATVLTPLVPLLLHVFLSVLVFALLQRRVPLLLALAAAIGFHALHNWSAIAFPMADWLAAIVIMSARCVAFGVLIVLILRFARPAAGPAPVVG